MSLQIDSIWDVVYYCGSTVLSLVEDALTDGEALTLNILRQAKQGAECVKAVEDEWFNGGS